jgi:hypothetical protein
MRFLSTDNTVEEIPQGFPLPGKNIFGCSGEQSAEQPKHQRKGGVEVVRKLVKVTLVMVAAIFMLSSVAMAFHRGSELKCNYCHTMHYSERGAVPAIANGYPVNADTGGPFEHLLVRKNITDLCLNCHKSGGASVEAPKVFKTTPDNTLPGGDFGYAATGTDVIKGHNPGGNPDNRSVNIELDGLNGGVNGIAPPGNWPIPGVPSSGTPEDLADGEFVCTNCHGVHGPQSGNVTSPARSYQSYGYRLLKAMPNGVNTTGDAIVSKSYEQVTPGGPVTVGPDGADLSTAEGPTNHNVYKGGFSNWCGACHPNFHGGATEAENSNNGTTSDGEHFVRHPSNTNLGSIASANRYGTSYDWQYPLVTTQTGAKGGTWTIGSSTEKVFCLACHKAHASNYANAVRWDTNNASATGQCNKCHRFGGGV